MQCRQLIIALLGGLGTVASTSGQAIVMPEGARPHVSFGLARLRVEGADTDSRPRTDYSLSYGRPLAGALGLGLKLGLAPDAVIKSQTVDMRQDFYDLSAALSFQYVHLFRYTVRLGGGALMERLRSHILGEDSVAVVWDGLVNGSLAVSYAISPDWEIGPELALQYRLRRGKGDWVYGFALHYNL